MEKLVFTIILFINLSVLGQNWKPVYQPFDSLATLCERQGDDVASRKLQQQYVHLMYAMATEQSYFRPLQWRAMYWDAYLLMRNGRVDSALYLARAALKLVDTLRYEYDYRRLQRIAINCSTDTMDYFMTYKAYREQLQFYESVDDSLNIANTCVTLGTIFSTLGEHKKAMDYHKRGDTLYRQLGNTDYMLKNRLNIANCLQAAGKHKEAVCLLEGILKNPVTARDTAFHLQVLASGCVFTDNKARREEYVRNAYRLAACYGRKEPIMKSSINMGYLFLQKAEIDSALLFYGKVSAYVQQHEDKELLLPALYGMSRCYQIKRQWDSAFIYLDRVRSYEDSLQGGTLPEMYLMESRIAIDGYERTLYRERKEANMHRLILILVLVLVIVSAAFACYMLWMRQRKILMKKRMEELEKKELAARLENEELRHHMEMEAKDRELTSNAIILTEKNKLLNDLAKRISSRSEVGDIAPRTALELQSRIRASNGTEDEEWKNFRVHFEQVHPDFFCRLKETYPSLTENELRLCAYLRTGMERKQIAMMLSVQPDTVKKACVRMRKKFPLNTEDLLEDFLRNL